MHAPVSAIYFHASNARSSANFNLRHMKTFSKSNMNRRSKLQPPEHAPGSTTHEMTDVWWWWPIEDSDWWMMMADGECWLLVVENLKPFAVRVHVRNAHLDTTNVQCGSTVWCLEPTAASWATLWNNVVVCHVENGKDYSTIKLWNKRWRLES